MGKNHSPSRGGGFAKANLLTSLYGEWHSSMFNLKNVEVEHAVLYPPISLSKKPMNIFRKPLTSRFFAFKIR